MVQPLKFRDAALAKLGPPEDLLAKLETALQTTHRITKAEDASQIPLPAVMKHVVDTLALIVKDELRPHLIVMFDQHIDAVGDEYEMDEGGVDGLDVEQAKAWWSGLLAAQFESFAGEVRGIVGDEAVHTFIESDESTEALVDAILQKPIDDTGVMKIKLGITPEQLQPLVRGVHTNWAEGPATEESEVMPPANAEIRTVETTPAPEPAAPLRRRGRAPRGSKKEDAFPAKTEDSLVTKATREMLEALYSFSSVRDDAIAEALGVSRVQVNNYRHGRQLLDPTPKQSLALINLARLHAKELTNAASTFELETM